MTNREWLNTLTDEEFADWLVNQPYANDKYYKLHTIMYQYNSSYLGVLDWLRKEVVGVEDINNAPTADAEPVRHGHWEIAIGYDMQRKFYCSECSKMAFENSKYCPNCGAKMDEVAE